MVSFRKIEILPRVSAALLLSAYILDFESKFGKTLLILAMCGLIYFSGILIKLFTKKKWIEIILQDELDLIFWPAILLIWMSEAYSKGSQIWVIVILFCLSIVSSIAALMLTKHKKQ